MTKKTLVIYIILICSSSLYGQIERSNFSFGLSFGSKSSYSTGGITLEYLFFKKVELNAGGCFSRIEGIGVTQGVSYLFTNTKFIPLIGCNYSSMSGRDQVETKDLTNYSHYRTPCNNFLTPFFGIRYQDESMAFRFTISYKYAMNSKKVIFENGVQDEILEQSYNEKFKGGVGFGICVIFHLGFFGLE